MVPPQKGVLFAVGTSHVPSEADCRRSEAAPSRLAHDDVPSSSGLKAPQLSQAKATCSEPDHQNLEDVHHLFPIGPKCPRPQIEGRAMAGMRYLIGIAASLDFLEEAFTVRWTSPQGLLT